MTHRERVEHFAVNSGWSEGEIIYLCSEWVKGTPITKIAQEMERKPQTIKRKVRRLGLTARVDDAICSQQPHAAKMSTIDNREGFAKALKTLRG